VEYTNSYGDEPASDKRNDIIDFSVKRADTSDPLNNRDTVVEYTDDYGDESVKRADIEYSLDSEEPLKRAVGLT
jgi:hypothetical protein